MPYLLRLRGSMTDGNEVSMRSLITGGLDETLAEEVGLYNAFDLTLDLSPAAPATPLALAHDMEVRATEATGIPSGPCCRHWQKIRCAQTLPLPQRLAVELG